MRQKKALPVTRPSELALGSSLSHTYIQDYVGIWKPGELTAKGVGVDLNRLELVTVRVSPSGGIEASIPPKLSYFPPHNINKEAHLFLI